MHVCVCICFFILTDVKGLWIRDAKKNVYGMPSAQLQVSLYSDQFIRQ